jgi:THO complex subunit 4
MASKLDQSLEDITKSRRQSGRANARRRSGPTKAPPTKAPVGGIKKNTKPVRGAAKGTAVGLSAPLTESKIIVSGLVSLQIWRDVLKTLLIAL